MKVKHCLRARRVPGPQPGAQPALFVGKMFSPMCRHQMLLYHQPPQRWVTAFIVFFMIFTVIFFFSLKMFHHCLSSGWKQQQVTLTQELDTEPQEAPGCLMEHRLGGSSFWLLLFPSASERWALPHWHQGQANARCRHLMSSATVLVHRTV